MEAVPGIEIRWMTDLKEERPEQCGVKQRLFEGSGFFIPGYMGYLLPSVDVVSICQCALPSFMVSL